MANDLPARGPGRPRGSKNKPNPVRDLRVRAILKRIDAGETQAEIAKAYGVSKQAISKLVITARGATRRPSPWTPDRVALLSEMWPEGRSWPLEQIARRLGVSRHAVTSKAHRLGLPHRPPAPRPGSPWTPDRIEIMRKMWGQGRQIEDIARHIGLSRHAAAGKARQLGLPHHPRAFGRLRRASDAPV